MEIYQVKAFATVAKLGNLTRAAETLHVTQPAVTGQIKALEEELGVTLFDRRPGKITLTRTGELLLGEAEQLLSVAGSLMSRAKELRGNVTGHFVIGVVGDPESMRLASLLTCLVQTLPLLEIKTRQGHSEELRELVAASAINGAYYIGPGIPRDVLGMSLQTVHYRIAAPFSESQKLAHAVWREIADMPWIGSPPQHHSRLLTRDLFANQGLTPRVVLEADESTSPHALVRSGLGLALLREDVALAAAERGEVAVWPHARVAALLSFIYPKTAEHDPATVATLSQLKQVWKA